MRRTVGGDTIMIRVLLYFSGRDTPILFRCHWPATGDVPPEPNVIIESMQEGVLLTAENSALAWDDNRVEFMSVQVVPEGELEPESELEVEGKADQADSLSASIGEAELACRAAHRAACLARAEGEGGDRA